ncbi:hypothetical protein CMV_022865 [Castanea mollissima]|uniref:Uncharacterized protein n=1 Tax=Castanea mollissima TaxID=60419 RepID=A0A8J4QP77_9ROSI|nr:hypothetical protein CMV_022865 [Castanea mollissima]
MLDKRSLGNLGETYHIIERVLVVVAFQISPTHEQGQCPGFLCSPPTNALIWLWTDLPVCFFRLVLDAANTACGWMLAFKNRTHCLRMDMGS